MFVCLLPILSRVSSRPYLRRQRRLLAENTPTQGGNAQKEPALSRHLISRAIICHVLARRRQLQSHTIVAILSPFSIINDLRDHYPKIPSGVQNVMKSPVFNMEWHLDGQKISFKRERTTLTKKPDALYTPRTPKLLLRGYFFVASSLTK